MKKFYAGLTVFALLLSTVFIPVNVALADEGGDAPAPEASTPAVSEEAPDAPGDEPVTDEPEAPAETPAEPVVPPTDPVDSPDEVAEETPVETPSVVEEEEEPGTEENLFSRMTIESFSLLAEEIPQCTEEQEEVATLQVFFDDFTDQLSQWTAGSRWSSTGNPNRAAQVNLNCTALMALFGQCQNISGAAGRLTTATSTEGYSDLELSFEYRVAKPLESSDHFFAEWSADGNDWETIPGFNLSNQGSSASWTTANLSLPAEAEDLPNLDVRFQASFTANTQGGGVEPQFGDEVRIDNVIIRGDKRVCEVPPPPVDVCENLEGVQETVPAGYEAEGNQCTLIPNEPPVIEILGDNPFTLTINNPFVDPFASSTDPEDGDLTSLIATSTDLNITATGTYSYVYSVTDLGDLTAYATRTINVIDEVVEPQPNQVPVITILGDNPFTLFVGDIFVDPFATSTDAEDGDITEDIATSSPAFDANTIGTYDWVYSVTDSDEASAYATRTINVIARPEEPAPNQSPVLTILGDNPFTLTVGTAYLDAGATSTDAEDGDLTEQITATTTLDVNTIGSYDFIYSVTDTNGSTTEATRIIHVIAGDDQENPDDEDEPRRGGSSGGGCRAGAPCDRSDDGDDSGDDSGDDDGSPVTPAGLITLGGPTGPVGGAVGQGGTEDGALVASADDANADVVGFATTTITSTTTAASTSTDANNLDQAAALGALDLLGFKWYWWLLLILILIAIGYYTFRNKEEQY